MSPMTHAQDTSRSSCPVFMYLTRCAMIGHLESFQISPSIDRRDALLRRVRKEATHSIIASLSPSLSLSLSPPVSLDSRIMAQSNANGSKHFSSPSPRSVSSVFFVPLFRPHLLTRVHPFLRHITAPIGKLHAFAFKIRYT